LFSLLSPILREKRLRREDQSDAKMRVHRNKDVDLTIREPSPSDRGQSLHHAPAAGPRRKDLEKTKQ